jgi:hypothetical protein
MEERTYAVQVLLEEFLGLTCFISVGQTIFAAEITLKNGRRLLIEDHFFKGFPNPLSYLRPENIPSQVPRLTRQDCPFLSEADLPVIYGHPSVEVAGDQVRCGVDIFASAFFMLTRWEEYVRPERDVHGRFPAAASLAFREGFLHRPVVNEYLELLWNLLTHAGIDHKRKERRFEAVITHDVDYPLLWNNLFSLIRKTGGSLLKRRNPNEAIFYIRNYCLSKQGKAKDPFDTFDYLMTQAETHGLKAHFFFLCGGEHALDNPHSFPQPFIGKLIKEIESRGHYTGFHPSYETCRQPSLFRKELGKLNAVAQSPARIGRQHFLRFEVPTTWQIWEDNGMEWDSTVYYAEAAGFRCGVCWAFPVFNILTRKTMHLREIPLTLMEGTFLNYLKLSPENMMEESKRILDTVKLYHGSFVLLWHNSVINTPEWQPYKSVYEQIFDLI